MSRLTQGRRWAAQSRRKKRRGWTEGDITPEEARAALHAIVLQTGCVLDQVFDYDPMTDRFYCRARRHDGKQMDVFCPGETVAKTVIAARTLTGTAKSLRRPSDKHRSIEVL